jgi:hypothetical protein
VPPSPDGFPLLVAPQALDTDASSSAAVNRPTGRDSIISASLPSEKGEQRAFCPDEAGAGDFGRGGVAVFAPESDTRVIIATNTYDRFDIESLARSLARVAAPRRGLTARPSDNHAS